MSSYSRQQLEEWLKTIDVKADSVIDIGGSQLKVKGRTKSWEVKDYKILDLDQPHECKQRPDIICDIQKNSAGFEVFDYGNKLDIAFCLEVSEYWYNPYQALLNINYLLKQGGILYISFHFVYKCHPPEGEDCLRYTPYGVEKLLQKTGFKILEHKYRMANSDYLAMYYADDKMRGTTKINDYVTGSLIKAIKL